MRGHFNVVVKDAGGLKDEDFLAAKESGKLQELLNELGTAQRAKSDNMLMHWLTSSFISRVIGHSFPNAPYPIYVGSIFPWLSISLMTTDAEPTYSDNYNWYGTKNAHFDNIGDATGSKGWDDVAEPWQFGKAAGGKEEVYARFRWIWLPSQGNSNSIRSVGVFGCQDDSQGTGPSQRYMVARVRLKSPTTGLPVVLVKNFNQVLVIEYNVFFVSI